MTKTEIDEFASMLFAANNKIVLKALSELRKSGHKEHLPALIELLNSTASLEIKTEITSILNQLKETASVEIIANAIKEDKYKGILQTLLASCWNSGLDYGKHLLLFTEVFINQPFLEAFEAYTLIDSTDGILFSAKDIATATQLLRESYPKSDTEKKPLFESLILILEDKKQA